MSDGPFFIVSTHTNKPKQVLAAEQAEGAQKGQQRLLLFPQAKTLYDAGAMERLADHLDICKEVGGHLVVWWRV